MAQMGFFDLSDRYASLDAKKDPLIEIDAVVRGKSFVRLLSGSGASRMRIASPARGASR
jgi:hypothetical protein